MKHNDTQSGSPEIIYKDTKTNVEAIAAPVEGMKAYATDTHLEGVYNGTAWKWIGPSALLGNGASQYQTIITGATPFVPVYSGFLLDGTTGGKTVLAVTSGKVLTLTAVDNYNLTVPATGTAALLNQANSFTLINPLTTIAESWIGPSSTAGIYFKGGNVGIGTTNPKSLLHVAVTSGASTVTPYAPIIMSRYWGSDSNVRGAAIFNSLDSTGLYDQLVFGVTGDSGNRNSPALYASARMVIQSNGNVGIGTTLADTTHTTYAKLNIQTGSLLFTGQSASAYERPLVSLVPAFVVATDASRTTRFILNTFDAAGAREVMRGEASGSAPMIGFLGAVAVIRPSAYTQTYSTASKTLPAATAADLATTATTQLTPYGFASQAQGDNIATQFNLLRADLDATKQVVNQLTDDLQALGLVA